MLDLVKRYPLVTFFVLAYAFAWALTAGVAVSPYVFGFIALFGPAAAAIVVTGITDGRAGVMALLKKTLIWRVEWVWYLVALGLPVLISLLASLWGVVFRVEVKIAPVPFTGISALLFVFAVGEELGWRGYALPKLQDKFSPFTSSLILGLLWAAWHLPTFILPVTPQYGTPIIPFFLFVVGLTFVFTWLHQNTSGSVLLATILHGAVNTIGFANPNLDMGQTRWLIGAGYMILAAMLVFSVPALYPRIGGQKSSSE